MKKIPKIIIHIADICKNLSPFVWNASSNTVQTRIRFVLVGFILIFAIIALRLFIIANTNYKDSKNASNSHIINRKDIVDRNNNLLAVNLPASSLYANPHNIIDASDAAHKLVAIIPNLNFDRVLGDLKSGKKFIWIKRDLTPLEHEKIYNLGIPGLGFEREHRRIYPYGNLLSHIIGYVGRDMNGLAGVEQFFDKFLNNQQEIEDGSQLGNTLQLSIDVRVQNILSEVIEHFMQKFHAKGATGIIANPNTGEILAVVSKPDFDPYEPASAKPEQLFNMATQGVYEIGSGMKGLTVAIGLDAGVTTLNDAYDVSYMQVGNFIVKDTHPMHGWHSVAHIFLKSSNIGVSQIMLEIGKSNLLEYLRKLKLLEPLNIEVLERARPLFPNYSRWNELSLTTMSYGYGISESPMHFVQAMIPVVNGGIMYPLTLIKRTNTKSINAERVFKESTSIAMRKLMRLVVTEGTGSKADIDGYYVGGKTGTAYVAMAGKYDKNKRISSFFGILPAYNPEYIIYVAYNEPIGNKESFGFAGGGWIGAPTVREVFSRLITLYGIQQIDPDSEQVRQLNDIEYEIKDET